MNARQPVHAIASDLSDLLAIKTPTVQIDPVQAARLPHAEPLPAAGITAQPAGSITPPAAVVRPLKAPAHVPANRRMKWIVTTLRALAAQQA
jgi:hypothetical protein